MYFDIFFLGPFRAAPKAYGSSQARGQIGAIATGLHHSRVGQCSRCRWQTWLRSCGPKKRKKKKGYFYKDAFLNAPYDIKNWNYPACMRGLVKYL